LTDTELEIMRCVWKKGAASASSVQMQMVREGKETAYTTVKTMLDRLVKAGICTVKEIKGRYHYSPRLSQAEIAREWYRHLNEKIYGKRRRM
jgi:predicted transcriptional regulator